jgi:UDPglucose 6-dehydrogenase
MEKVNICMVGTGYVGLVTGTCLAELGHNVVCVDNDKKKIATLKKGKIPIYEPGLDKIVQKNIKRKRLFFAHSVAEGMHFKGKRAEAVFIAVGTPPRVDGSADLSYVKAVAQEIATSMNGYTVVVEKSTVPVETCEWLEKTISRFDKRRIPFDVVSNPEFLSEGSAITDFFKSDRIVIGTTSKKAEAIMKRIYEPLKVKLMFTDTKSAELIKHASNSFLATKISFINAVANVCERTGASVEEVAMGIGLDKRIGHSFLRAGIGFGGFCFPKDIEAFYWISKRKGYEFSLLKSVKEINEDQRLWVIRNAEKELKNLKGKNIAMLGLAFKPNTDDMRYAPSVYIANALLERGAKIKAYDPISMPNAKKVIKGIRFCKNPYECLKGADCMVLVTEWKEFKDLDMQKALSIMKTPIILDGRNLYNPKRIRNMGFTYRSVGRP